MEIGIGVDGGGSRTTAIGADLEGRIIAAVEGDGINYNNIGMDEARHRMRDIAVRLLDKCGATGFRFLSIGMSALDGRADAETLKLFAGDAFPVDKLVMDSDTNGALYAATLDGAGTIVVCGTGSMVQSGDGIGNVRVGGGWGHVIGDAGSAYSLAIDGIRAAAACWDGIAAPTELCAAALEFFGERAPRSIIGQVYSPEMDVARLAEFAQRVVKCAQNGDAAAMEVLSRNMNALAMTAAATAFNSDSATIWLYGGVLEHSVFARDIFKNALLRCAPGMTARLLEMSPAVGALLYGFKSRGELTKGIVDMVSSTYIGVFTK